ncbi:hypothetical protein OROMI_028978 [Orobanche minor]
MNKSVIEDRVSGSDESLDDHDANILSGLTLTEDRVSLTSPSCFPWFPKVLHDRINLLKQRVSEEAKEKERMKASIISLSNDKWSNSCRVHEDGPEIIPLGGSTLSLIGPDDFISMDSPNISICIDLRDKVALFKQQNCVIEPENYDDGSWEIIPCQNGLSARVTIDWREPFMLEILKDLSCYLCHRQRTVSVTSCLTH